MGLRSEQEAFPKIEARLAKVDKANQKVVHVFKIKIKQGGAVAKTMMLDLVQLKFYEGDNDAECTMIVDDDLFTEIINKTVDATEALKEGKFEVEGNVELLVKLKEALTATASS